jgi:hypothetical protein
MVEVGQIIEIQHLEVSPKLIAYLQVLTWRGSVDVKEALQLNSKRSLLAQQ